MRKGKKHQKACSITILTGPPEKPEIVSFSRTDDKIAIRWIVGLDGGFEQHFILHYWEDKKDNNVQEVKVEGHFVAGETASYNITGLKLNKIYLVQVIAVNEYNSGTESLSDLLVAESICKSKQCILWYKNCVRKNMY